MRQQEFMQELETGLRGRIADEEIQDILAEYRSFFVSGAAENKSEEDICALLGSPAALVQSLTGTGNGEPKAVPKPGIVPAPLGKRVAAVLIDRMILLLLCPADRSAVFPADGSPGDDHRQYARQCAAASLGHRRGCHYRHGAAVMASAVFAAFALQAGNGMPAARPNGRQAADGASGDRCRRFPCFCRGHLAAGAARRHPARHRNVRNHRDCLRFFGGRQIPPQPARPDRRYHRDRNGRKKQ